MQSKAPKWLEDIAEQAGLIPDWTAGRTLADYEGDDLLRSAAERGLGIIGRAAEHIVAIDAGTAARISGLESFVAVADHLEHDYDATDDGRVWMVIQETLPRLRAEVEALLLEAVGGERGDVAESRPLG